MCINSADLDISEEYFRKQLTTNILCEKITNVEVLKDLCIDAARAVHVDKNIFVFKLHYSLVWE